MQGMGYIVKNKFFLIVIMLSIITVYFINTQPFGKEESEQVQKQENMVLQPNTTDSTSEKSHITLSDEDFIVNNDNTFIELGSKYKNLKTDEKIINTHYADENHVYNVFIFENFTITTEPWDEGIIDNINLRTPILKTSRGASIGDPISDVFKKYGLVDGDSSEFYMYHYNGKILKFYVDEKGKVTNIQFELV
jgi:hypothetical protein